MKRCWQNLASTGSFWASSCWGWGVCCCSLSFLKFQRASVSCKQQGAGPNLDLLYIFLQTRLNTSSKKAFPLISHPQTSGTLTHKCRSSVRVSYILLRRHFLPKSETKGDLRSRHGLRYQNPQLIPSPFPPPLPQIPQKGISHPEKEYSCLQIYALHFHTEGLEEPSQSPAFSVDVCSLRDYLPCPITNLNHARSQIQKPISAELSKGFSSEIKVAGWFFHICPGLGPALFQWAWEQSGWSQGQAYLQEHPKNQALLPVHLAAIQQQRRCFPNGNLNIAHSYTCLLPMVILEHITLLFYSLD